MWRLENLVVALFRREELALPAGRSTRSCNYFRREESDAYYDRRRSSLCAGGGPPPGRSSPGRIARREMRWTTVLVVGSSQTGGRWGSRTSWRRSQERSSFEESERTTRGQSGSAWRGNGLEGGQTTGWRSQPARARCQHATTRESPASGGESGGQSATGRGWGPW